MEKIVPLFEEYAAGRDKHLVIVDVQKEFEKWMKPGFIQKVRERASSVPNTYQIWDKNRAKEPSDSFPNEKKIAPKRYGYELRREDIPGHFSGEVRDRLISDFDAGSFTDGENKRKAYPARNGDMLFFVGKSHKFFMAEKELIELLEYFKSLKDGITLCGGADGECLADIEAMLDYYGVPYDRDEDCIYAS